MGAPNSSSDPESSPGGPSTSDEWSTYETWLVRILVTLAFGLAFGIEGMTLIRSFVIDDEGEDVVAQTASEERSVLREGQVLLPSFALPVRAHRLKVRAGSDDWTFTVVARPDSIPDRRYTLTFDSLTTTSGAVRTTAPSHTWAPGDTVAFAASWMLPVGQRPEALSLTATTEVSDDSTATVSRTVDVGRVPVRQE